MLEEHASDLAVRAFKGRLFLVMGTLRIDAPVDFLEHGSVIHQSRVKPVGAFAIKRLLYQGQDFTISYIIPVCKEKMDEYRAYVRFDEYDRSVKRKSQDGTGRVMPDAGKTPEKVHVRAKSPAMFLRDNFADLLKRYSPAIISQALPCSKNISEIRIRQGPEVRKLPHKSGVFFEHTIYLRLLQHHLRHEYPVRVLRLSPRQFSPMLVV